MHIFYTSLEAQWLDVGGEKKKKQKEGVICILDSQYA